MAAEEGTTNRANTGMKIDAALVRELAEMLADTGLTEIEVAEGDRRIRVGLLRVRPRDGAQSARGASKPPMTPGAAIRLEPAKLVVMPAL